MKILVGYDGSAKANRALKLSQRYAGCLGAEIIVVRAITRTAPIDYGTIQSVEQNLEGDAGKILGGYKIPYKTYLLISDASVAEQLVRFAEENSIDEMIIGARTRSEVGKFMFGSTTQYVVLNAPCPVMTIK